MYNVICSFYFIDRSGVKLICEVGFDLGHSAGLFLLTTNPTVQLISFDTGKSEWSDGQVDYVKSMFPGRFKYVKGGT